jgi:uncharacterized membrane protein YfcA
LVLACGAFGAGLVDAVVGGGGLIQIPAMFTIFPNMAPGHADRHQQAGQHLWHRRRRRQLRAPRGDCLVDGGPGCAGRVGLRFLGRLHGDQGIPADFMRTLLPVVLVAVAIYTFRQEGLRQRPRAVHSGAKEQTAGAGDRRGIGFYDGFFGPGTGSFLVFLFVRIFGFDFLARRPWPRSSTSPATSPRWSGSATAATCCGSWA